MLPYCPRLLLGLASIASLVLSTPVAAIGKKPELPAGGNTIAGPGRVTIDPSSQTTVLLQSASTPFDLCVTVVNVGPPGTTVGAFVKDPGSVTNGLQAFTPGDAVSACRAASNEVFITCTSAGPPCAALWRVDQSR